MRSFESFSFSRDTIAALQLYPKERLRPFELELDESRRLHFDVIRATSCLRGQDGSAASLSDKFLSSIEDRCSRQARGGHLSDDCSLSPPASRQSRRFPQHPIKSTSSKLNPRDALSPPTISEDPGTLPSIPDIHLPLSARSESLSFASAISVDTSINPPPFASDPLLLLFQPNYLWYTSVSDTVNRSWVSFSRRFFRNCRNWVVRDVDNVKACFR